MTPFISFFLATICAIAVQGLFSIFEMSAVSFNKVRLQYYVSQGKKRAVWLNYLLSQPSRLFGTTLFGVNAMLQIGSECARRFYESIRIDPDWAPLTQVLLVVLFAELAPMFAARRHPEQVAMSCVPVMMLLTRILTPITWAFDAFSKMIHQFMGESPKTSLFLSREEVKMAFEEEKDSKVDDFSMAVSQIFQLKNLTAGQCMTPLSAVFLAPSSATLAEVRHLLSVHYQPMIAIYHRYPHNIVGIAHLRDLLKMDSAQRVFEHTRSPWFVLKETSVLQILEQFRRNGQSLAVILDLSGQACGLLSLEQIISLIFGEEAQSVVSPSQEIPNLYVERTLPGEMKIADFNEQFQANIPFVDDETLSDLIVNQLNHHPVKGETVRIGAFDFQVSEPTLTGVKTLSVRTASE